MIWLINVRTQKSGRFVEWTEQFPILSTMTFPYPTGISLRDSCNLDMPFVSYLHFIVLKYAPIFSSVKHHKSYFHLYFMKQYLVAILRQWSRLWLFTDNNHSYIKWLLLYPTCVVLQRELLQLLISFLYLTFFQSRVSQKKHC